MTVHPTRSIHAALLKKGFRQDGTHHLMYWFFAGDRKTGVRTKISHGATEYGNDLLSRMAREMRLRRRELDDFIRCPMTGEDYQAILAGRTGIGE
jgi:hypothetical protein